MIRLAPGLRTGTMTVPESKSHAHRVLIAEFLAGRTEFLRPSVDDCADIGATKRCLSALAAFPRKDPISTPCTLDCGESGTTRRLLGPLVAALNVTPNWVMQGRLASRPQIDYVQLQPGVHELAGDVSSQFVSGLLFALPLLAGDSEIRLTSPLASRGYVEMTCAVLADYGVVVQPTETGFRIPGAQHYRAPTEGPCIETDWSGAAFPLAMNELGNEIRLVAPRLASDSRQPDRAIVSLLSQLKGAGERIIGIDECPDLFPVLTIVAAHRNGTTRFTGIRRLRLKESDRVAAMQDVLTRFGVPVQVADAAFVVSGRLTLLKGGPFHSFADHRIAMSIAVGATVSSAPVEIDDETCAAKSFPSFFAQFENLVARPPLR